MWSWDSNSPEGRKQRQEDGKFKVILNYKLSSKSAWAT